MQKVTNSNERMQRRVRLTTAEPTPTPTAVVAIWANNPGWRGCAPTAEGGLAGAAGGTFAGRWDGGRGALRPELKPLCTQGSTYSKQQHTIN